MPFNLGFGEILVLAVIAILMFGGQLPDVARKVGRGFSDFKRGMNEQLDELRTDVQVEEPPADWEPPAQDENCPGMGAGGREPGAGG
ncbi:MAG: twin-arginine translocase TatA/TatE family subunit [Planctomycetota bacterium]